MASFYNIEKSAWRPGEYVGYGAGIWHIKKGNSSFGKWAARRPDGSGETLFAFRLSDMSAKLEKLSEVETARIAEQLRAERAS